MTKNEKTRKAWEEEARADETAAQWAAEARADETRAAEAEAWEKLAETAEAEAWEKLAETRAAEAEAWEKLAETSAAARKAAEEEVEEVAEEAREAALARRCNVRVVVVVRNGMVSEYISDKPMVMAILDADDRSTEVKEVAITNEETVTCVPMVCDPDAVDPFLVERIFEQIL